MKTDLPALIRRRDLQAVMVIGDEGYNVLRDYLTNGARISQGIIIVPAEGETTLFVSGMEIEEARKSGLRCLTMAEAGYYELLSIANPADREATYWARCLQAAGISEGRVGLYGNLSANVLIAVLNAARVICPQYDFVGEAGLTLFDEAFLTKDTHEIARLQAAAAKTSEVLARAWDFIASHRAEGDIVMQADGTPLTIGAVKTFICRELMDRGLEDTGMIFAQGRDGAFPHSHGEDDQALRLGQAIVFDLFPRETGGGYHHDVTRTWCIGYAPPEVQTTYEQVMTAFDRAVETFAVGKPTHLMQEAVQDYFESLGHPTGRTHPGTDTGYMHGLGHGIGLLIHERPGISHTQRTDVFAVGNCLTIEPGLYFPDAGYGVRIEDLFIVTPAGELQALTSFHKQLVLPLRG